MCGTCALLITISYTLLLCVSANIVTRVLLCCLQRGRQQYYDDDDDVVDVNQDDGASPHDSYTEKSRGMC
jgi:hypothetical protein